MARYIGAVRFDDGHLLYFVYDGTTDIALPSLYQSPDAASQHRADPPPKLSNPFPPGEPVKVMPYFEQGNPEVSFHSRADRMLMVFTGPRSFEEQFSTPNGGWFGHD